MTKPFPWKRRMHVENIKSAKLSAIAIVSSFLSKIPIVKTSRQVITLRCQNPSAGQHPQSFPHSIHRNKTIWFRWNTSTIHGPNTSTTAVNSFKLWLHTLKLWQGHQWLGVASWKTFHCSSFRWPKCFGLHRCLQKISGSGLKESNEGCHKQASLDFVCHVWPEMGLPQEYDIHISA